MADHLAGWQTFQFTVGKLLFSFVHSFCCLCCAIRHMCQTAHEMQRWIGNTACLFYNYDFISFSNCTGNVKCLGWHSSIIVGSSFMCPVFFSSPCSMHSPSPFAWQTGSEPRRKASLFCLEVPDILLAIHQNIQSGLLFPAPNRWRKAVPGMFYWTH